MLEVAAIKRLGDFQLTAEFQLPAAGVLALRTPFLLPRVRRPSTAQPQNRGPIGAEA